MKLLILLLLFVFTVNLCESQEISLKDQAKEEFRNEHYNKAISLLNQAATITPSDPEIYYLLGFYTHYNAYDSRPLKGYDNSYSKKVFGFLDKALQLKPDYGDAKYFYGAECSAAAFNYMQSYQADSLGMVYKKAYEKGAYPDWLIEFGKNFLNSCEPNTILFTGGNPDFDVSMYLQLHKNFRTDITLVPLSFINRPFYIRFLKNGLENTVRKIKIELTDEQIENMHPYKWDTTLIKIPVPGKIIDQYKLPENSTMEWMVVPDLVSKQINQQNQSQIRAYLSPQRAMLLQIVEANAWERPIFFSNVSDPELFGGLQDYMQDCGMVSKLLPFKTAETKWKNDIEKLEELVTGTGNFKFYPNTVINDLPRISGITFIYHQAFMNLALYYKENSNYTGIGSVLSIFDKYLKIGLNKEMEDQYYQYIKMLNIKEKTQ